MTVSKDNVARVGEKAAKDGFPRIVIIIILAEFCERFSYSGMKAFLTLYLRSKLDYSDERATEIYHVFSTFVYLFPILGGILADNYLGKFKTILYMMFIYAAGNLLVAVTAIPFLEIPKRLYTVIGLFLITLGTGGIKPCVTAFGGDQFILPDQEKQLALYFSILYFNLCTGSLIAKTVSPILRSEIHCFGDKDCYSLAFGAPGLVVFISIVIFVSARKSYVMKTPEGDMVIRFLKCISLGVKNKIFGGKREDTHWLDTTETKYEKRFIREVKKTLSILMLFMALPMFWALLDQMGSRWTLQATKMDGRLGFITIKPDQLQVFSPICILIFIPLSQKYIYPFLTSRSLLTNPLHKLTLGGVLAALAFVLSGLVEIYIKTTYPVLPEPGFSQLRIYNGNPCSISIQNDQQNIMYTIPSLSHFTNKQMNVKNTTEVRFRFDGSCIETKDEIFSLEDNMAISFFISGNNIERFKENVDKSKSGLPIVRFLLSDNVQPKNITLFNEKRNEVEILLGPGVGTQTEVFNAEYSIRVGDTIVSSGIELNNGGVYNLIMDKVGDKYETNVITITQPNSITMAWLLPQFLIISVAEVLFAVTGNEFAFKESPESMKAVMSAAWLLTEAAGNVIIIIVTRVFTNYKQETQSFIYTGLMCISILLFHVMSSGYKFGPLEEQVGKKERSNSEVKYHQVKEAEECFYR
ncbi:peptide transporter family 1-like [Danaus plexippus]|uniref:peptide transporter family 1-like n=1 Tax=Danaus plexippus TaxID=13037 RepID=UPI002AAF30C2|nr:peptide transporter family 1-like [Danaus plexippus]